MTEADAGVLIHLAMSLEMRARLEGQNGGHQSRADTDQAFTALQRAIQRHMVPDDDSDEVRE